MSSQVECDERENLWPKDSALGRLFCSVTPDHVQKAIVEIANRCRSRICGVDGSPTRHSLTWALSETGNTILQFVHNLKQDDFDFADLSIKILYGLFGTNCIAHDRSIPCHELK